MLVVKTVDIDQQPLTDIELISFIFFFMLMVLDMDIVQQQV